VLVLAALLVTVAAPPPPAGFLSWLPANTVAITGAPRDQVSQLKWLRETITPFLRAVEKAPPKCWDQVAKPIVASYQVWADAAGDEAAALVQGAVDRARAEACIAETFGLLGSPLQVTRAGAITQFDNDMFGRTYVGWTPSWVVWHPQRARVEELLAASRKPGSISPALAAAIARADRGGLLWAADTRDDSSLLTGVPSRSWTVATRRVGATLLVRASFEYASPEDAKRAAAAVAAAGTDAGLPPELQALARAARPAVVDRSVGLQLDAKAVLDDRTMAALQAWLEKKRAALVKP